VALILGILSLLGVMALRRQRRWSGLTLILPALVIGGCATLVWSLALLSELPELRENELLLLLWPTDWLLIVPALRWLRGRFTAGRLLRGYLGARTALILLVGVGHLCGLLVQQPRVWVVVVLPLVVFWLALRRHHCA
jgi:hypothetical protein